MNIVWGKSMNHNGHRVSSGEQTLRLIVIAVFFILFVFGLVVSCDYGVAYDEPVEIGILQMNIREAAETFFSADSALVYKLEDSGIQRISTSIERDHGQAAYYPFAPILLRENVLSGNYEYADVARPYHYYTFIVCFTAVLGLYFIVKELFDDRLLAVLCAVIFFLSPRFFAESHYNNKDIVLLCLLINACLFGIRATKRRKLPDVLMFALMSALAANTKVIGLFFFAVIGLFYLLYISAARLWDRRSVVMMITAIAAFCLFYYLLTPAMWHDPLDFFAYSLVNAFKFSRWGGTVLFEGSFFQAHLLELPRSYLPKLILITTPPVILLLAVLGLVRLVWLAVKKLPDPADREPFFFTLMICLCALTPLLVAIVKKTVVYNGWRHFYFSYAGIILLSVYGLQWLLRRRRKAVALLASLFVLFAAVQDVMNHPYQYAYYNFLAGRNVEQTYELDYWTVSMKNALELVASADDRQLSISCLTGNRNQLRWGAASLDGETRARIAICDEPEAADYLIENTTYQVLDGTPDVPSGFRYMTSIYAYGSPIVNIYCRQQAV